MSKDSSFGPERLETFQVSTSGCVGMLATLLKLQTTSKELHVLCMLLRAEKTHFFRYLELNFTAKILNYILIAFTWEKLYIRVFAYK